MGKTDKSKQIEALVYSGDPTFQNVYPNLYIDVRSVGVANWVFRYQLRGRPMSIQNWQLWTKP